MVIKMIKKCLLLLIALIFTQSMSPVFANVTKPLLETNFSNGDISFFTQIYPEWEIISEGGKHLLKGERQSGASVPMISYNDYNTKNGSITLKASAASFHDFRIFLRYQGTGGINGGTFYFLAYNSDNKLYIRKRNNNVVTDVAAAALPSPLEANKFYVFHFEVLETTLKAFIANEDGSIIANSVVSGNDSDLTTGTFAVRCPTNTNLNPLSKILLEYVNVHYISQLDDIPAETFITDWNTPVVKPIPVPSGIFAQLAVKTEPEKGSLQINGNDFTYTPEPEYEGKVSFIISITDDMDAAAFMHVTINVSKPKPCVLLSKRFYEKSNDTSDLINITSGQIVCEASIKNSYDYENEVSVILILEKDGVYKNISYMKDKIPPNGNLTLKPEINVPTGDGYKVSMFLTGKLSQLQILSDITILQ